MPSPRSSGQAPPACSSPLTCGLAVLMSSRYRHSCPWELRADLSSSLQPVGVEWGGLLLWVRHSIIGTETWGCGPFSEHPGAYGGTDVKQQGPGTSQAVLE